MVESLFTARERFDPADGECWQRYVLWARIPALREVVSLDASLCGNLIDKRTDEDWAHLAEVASFAYFRDLDYVLRRVGSTHRRNILGVYRDPSMHIEAPPAPGFVFHGYDLVDEETMISALVNCGGFPKAFPNEELNEFGLITDHGRAADVQRRLVEEYPDTHHADCALYAIWRLKETRVGR